MESLDIAAIRQDYSSRQLKETDVVADPIKQFSKWFEEALHAQVKEPNAMTLSTINNAGHPAARIVLLKGIDDRGFSFFTNYESRKGRELTAYPYAALTFFWPELERQVRIEGEVSLLNKAESDTYYHSRPRGSQIGAWASAQSEVIASREELEQKWEALETEFEGKPIDRPHFWGGFLIKPVMIEFWQGRPSRLHDRLQYSLRNQQWVLERLSP